ncbi:MAG: hypothetical protein KF851_12085 [Pirellulaceae bacterium]|nr:hypothetical protein [Pirellulaceae bacterium]
MSQNVNKKTVSDLGIPEQFLWLADSPAYIDAEEIEAFYDATVRPYMRQGVTTTGTDCEIAGKLVSEIGLEGAVDSGKLVEILAAWLPKLSLKGSGTLSGEGSYNSKNNTNTEWHPITTPQRQLEQLALHYHLYQHSRLLTLELSELTSKATNDWIKDLPRGFVLLDIPPQTKLIPTYAEYGSDSISTRLFERVAPCVKRYGSDASKDEKLKYWQQIGETFEVQAALQAVEEKAGNIQVIDFRVLVGETGETLHLQFSPRGRYPKITFAYNLIRRAYTHGLRLVGTLRTEPDMKVLAVYEK